MSINSAMLAGVSGLAANSSALAAISDNIANVNTVGYKDNGINFETLVTGEEGNTTGSAGGVLSSASQQVTSQGTPTQTSSPTDLAISGQGMFITEPTSGAVNSSTPILYTRAGSFTPDSTGFLKNAANLYLLGWPTNAQGVVQTGSSVSSLSPINITNVNATVSPTTTVSLNSANLPSDSAIQPAVTSLPYAAGDMASGAITPDQTIPIKVSDSLGNEHELDLELVKTGSDTWGAEVVSNPTSDTGSTGNAIAQGNIVFNTDGSLNAASTTLPTSFTIPWAASLGVTPNQPITLNLGANGAKGTTGISQDGSSFAAGTAISDGTPFGNLTGVTIGNTGDVTATFDNGTSRVIAQVAMATFANEDGLNAVTGDAYQATFNSGTASINAPGSGGAGTLASNALESSTVDLSKEFTNLIITQRAYTASSKVITAADNMTQDLLAIIR